MIHSENNWVYIFIYMPLSVLLVFLFPVTYWWWYFVVWAVVSLSVYCYFVFKKVTEREARGPMFISLILLHLLLLWFVGSWVDYHLSPLIEVRKHDSFEDYMKNPYEFYSMNGLTLIIAGRYCEDDFVEFTVVDDRIILSDRYGKNFKLFKSIPKDGYAFAVKNISPTLNFDWSICKENIDEVEALREIGKAGYGYLFRGKVYSKDTVESYWDILDLNMRNYVPRY